MMKVRFIASMPPSGYSGGRLLALGMAEALALENEVEVDFITNNRTIMFEEFKSNSRIDLKIADFNSLDRFVDEEIDFLIIVPQMGKKNLHKKWVRHGQKCQAKILLINFESPNWFNKVSPFKRDAALWDGWTEVSKSASAILSISSEGTKYAKEFYDSVPDDCFFETIYPGINTIKADLAPDVEERKKQILFLTRIDSHKGFNALTPFLTEKLNGYTLIISVGNGKFPLLQKFKWKSRFRKHGIRLKILYKISTDLKFQLLKESALLYFPTRFEGFGLPPLEAAYCRTPCVCSDLPVLREFGKGAFVYGNPEQDAEMRNAIVSSLNGPFDLVDDWDRFAKIARMNEWGKRQVKIFKDLMN